MLNSLRDGQINYGTTNCSSAHVPPHNVVAPIHQNSLIPTEPTTPVVYPWNSNPRLDHLYGFHSRYYNLDYPTPYPPATNQYVPANMYRQNVPQCCQPCCRLRSQNIPKTSPPQVLYNPIRPVQQLNRSYKSKKTLKTPCSEQFLPYIPNELPVKYDTQNCYQQKYSSSYLNNPNYCPPANNLWIPPAVNPTWPTERLRPIGRHSGVVSHDYRRDKNYQRLPNYQSNPYPNPTSNTHKPYNYIPPIPDVHDYRSSVYHNPLKNNTSEYISHEQNSRLPILSQNNQSSSSYLQQYYNAQPVQSYPDVQRPSEPFKPPQITPQNSTKSNLNVREFLATWDEGEEETNEKSSDAAAPIVVLDCMTLEGDALTKIQEKLNVVSYENLEKVLKENQNPLVLNTEPNEIEYINNKTRLPSKSNFEPLDYTKRETGIIKPFINEKKTLPETNSQPEKSYSVNFDGMVAWYGKKNTDISSTDLIEKLADRIFNLSKSQENEGVSFGTAAYTGQITQTNRSIASSIKDSSKYIQNQQMFNLHHTEKCIEPSVINKIDCDNDHIPRISSCVLNESNKASTTKSNHMNSSCIVENITKKCLNVTNEESTPWNLDQGSQEQHLNVSLYDHSVIIKPLDFSSLTDETKCNPFVFEKNSSSVDKSNNGNDEFNKVLNENSNYSSTVSNNQHSLHQMDSSNRNFPVIVSPNIHRQEYNGFHESVIQRTGCDKNKLDKVPAQTDFENMNWNISNDLEKIMKNTNMSMEPSCLYDRNNYNILDNINSEKNVSTQWKDSVPCVDLTVSSKVNTNHDSFFDSWNFIESYENHSSKKINNPSTNNNEVHNQLFPNQMNSLVESNTKINISSEKVENETLATIKDIPFSKPNDMSFNNTRSRDVFNLNNRIPDFSDGFELPVINEPHEYMTFKKPSSDTENRADGSIFEHFTEPKCIRTTNDITNVKNDQNKSDIVGLPNFKDKEPLAPMPVPPKLNIVKPIIRDPSQMYTVIKQKLKYDNSNIVNDSSAITNKTGQSINDNQTNIFSVTDLKSKYNNVQSNQFDVWSEKFILKSDSNRSSNALVQCDVEITQFKSTPENRNTFISKSKLNENYQKKDTNLPGNTNGSNLTSDKIENKKINSADFLHCLESTKTDDQKYRDTLDEFETSFGFDMHCNNESNKSFHEGIVDKCLEERIQDQIGEHNINNIPDSNNTSINSTSNNTRMPFECDFQSGYLIKNYFDENKNKAVLFDQKEIRAHEKSVSTDFNYHSEIQHDFDLKRNANLNSIQSSEKNSNFNILNDINSNIKQSQNNNENDNFNFIIQDKSKHLFESIHDNSHIAAETSIVEKNNIGCTTIEDRHFEFENEEKNILDLTNSKRITDTNYPTEAAEVSKINDGSSNVYKLSKISKHSSVDFELSIDNANIFESNSSCTENKTETSELENNKNTFESTFHSETVKNIEHHINGKSIFELENNNSDMYQTQNLEKIHEFDFETRIIQNLEMECSNSNVHEPTCPKETYENENKIKSMYDYDIINEGNNAQNETNIEHFSITPEETQAEETSNLSCNDGTDQNDVMDTDQENIVDSSVFEDDFTAENNIHENHNSETRCDLDAQNENTEEDNLKKCDTQNNSNITNNTKIQNIFENVFDDFTNLNNEKDDSNLSENCRHNDDKCAVSKSQDSVEDQHLKIGKPETVFERDIEIKMDETLETSNNFLLQEFEDNSCSSTTSVSSSQSEQDLEEENNGVLMPKECNSKESNENTLNVDEKILDTSNKTVVYENTTMLEKQHNTYIKQSYIELINQNNIQTIKNKAVDIVQGDVTKSTYENIKSDLLNTIENTNKTLDNNDDQSNYSNSSLINKVELIYQKQCSEIVKPDNLAFSEPSSLNYLELICQRYSSGIVEVKEKNSSKRNSLNHIGSKYYQHSNNIVKGENSINYRSSSLNLAELTCQKYSEKVVEAEVVENVESNSFKIRFNNLDNVQSTCLQHSNNNVEVDNSTNSEPVKLQQPVLTFNKHSNEVVEYSTNIKSSQLSILKINDEFCIKNTADSENVDVDRKLPRVKFILKSHSKSLTKTNIFDEETKKSNVIKDERLSTRHIFKNRNKLYKPWKFIYRKESVGKPREIVKEVVVTECPVITNNADSISQNLKIPNCVGEKSISFTEFNQEQCSDNVTNEQCSDSVTNEPCPDSVRNEQCYDSATNEHHNESLNFAENQEIDNSSFVSIDDQPYEVFSREDLLTPVPSPFDDFRSETSTPDYCGGVELWDKSLENEYKTVLHKTISKLAKHRVNIRDKFNIRLLARRVNEMKQMKRRRRRFGKIKGVNNNIGKLAVGDIAIVECPPTTVLRWNVMAVKTADPVCKIKVQLPWGRIFNLNSHGAEDHQRTKDTKLELGPAKVEVRLSRTPGDWQVAACRSMVSPKSVVSVKRLVLQRATSPAKDPEDIFSSPVKDCDETLGNAMNCDIICSSPAKDCDNICNSSANDCCNDICSSPAKDFDDVCNSPTIYYDDSCSSPKKDYDESYSTASDSSSGGSCISSSSNTGPEQECSRKLPKIVIRRNGQNNNYTSYVSSNGLERGDDSNDGTPQLMVRLVRDRKLDEMAAGGVTTLHLRHLVPISESAADTHDAKRARYT